MHARSSRARAAARPRRCRRRELATIAHASKSCYVTFEELREGDMLEDEILAPGVISSVYVTGVARAERGAWPLGVPEVYGIDDPHLLQYAKAAKTREGFERYLDEHVRPGRAARLHDRAADR